MSDHQVHVISHPLVQHKLTLMREKDCSTNSFRSLLSEVGMLMAYEVTRDMPTRLVKIETPLETMLAPPGDSSLPRTRAVSFGAKVAVVCQGTKPAFLIATS